jgi:hypothetical protein
MYHTIGVVVTLVAKRSQIIAAGKVGRAAAVTLAEALGKILGRTLRHPPTKTQAVPIHERAVEL